MIAVAARRDPRTVRLFLESPDAVKSVSHASIVEAMQRLGFALPRRLTCAA